MPVFKRSPKRAALPPLLQMRPHEALHPRRRNDLRRQWTSPAHGCRGLIRNPACIEQVTTFERCTSRLSALDPSQFHRVPGFAFELVTLAIYGGEVVVGEIAPPFLDGSLDLLTVSFDAIPISYLSMKAVLVQKDGQFLVECRPAEPVFGREGGLGIHRGQGALAKLGDIGGHASYSARRRRGSSGVSGNVDVFLHDGASVDFS
jgi:hypothetical protein